MAGYIYVLLSAFFYATMGIIVKRAYALGMTPLMILTLISIAGAGVLWIVVFTLYRSELAHAKGCMKRIIIQSIFGNAVTSLGYFYALKHLDVSIAALLLFTHPAIVLVLAAYFYHERFGLYHYLSLGATLLGSILVIKIYPFEVSQISAIGILFGVAASFGLAFVNFYGQKTLEQIHPVVLAAFTMTFVGLILCLMKPPVYLFDGTLGYEVFAYALFLAVVCGVLPNILILKGIKTIGASRASIISTFELPLTILLAFLFLGETMDALQVTGGILILVGIFLLEGDRKKVVERET